MHILDPTVKHYEQRVISLVLQGLSSVHRRITGHSWRRKPQKWCEKEVTSLKNISEAITVAMFKKKKKKDLQAQEK